MSYLLDVTLQDVAAIVVYIRFRPGNEVTATAAEVPAVELEKFVAPSNSGRCRKPSFDRPADRFYESILWPMKTLREIFFKGTAVYRIEP